MKTLESYGITTRREEINKRLHDFHTLPQGLWARELLLCLFTPQSNPFHAEACLSKLEAEGLFERALTEDQIANILRTPHHYVRFHKVKAGRVIKFLNQLNEIMEIITSDLSPYEERERLVPLVNGFGWKEGSHALRNIGRCNLAILDRHILRCLKELGVVSNIPTALTEKTYKTFEKKFLKLADSEGVTIDFLDLLFWSSATGKVFK